jgi:abortive infection bacteriophage resistance protein
MYYFIFYKKKNNKKKFSQLIEGLKKRNILFEESESLNKKLKNLKKHYEESFYFPSLDEKKNIDKTNKEISLVKKNIK